MVKVVEAPRPVHVLDSLQERHNALLAGTPHRKGGFTASAMARWVLPTPDGPNSTTFSGRATKPSAVNSRTTLRSIEGWKVR